MKVNNKVMNAKKTSIVSIIGKYIVAFFIAIALSNPTFAQETREEYTKKCEMIKGLAYDIMKARQNGADAAHLMQVSRRNNLPIGETIVKLAFMEPQWIIEESKQRETAEFSNRLYMQCMKVHRDKYGY